MRSPCIIRSFLDQIISLFYTNAYTLRGWEACAIQNIAITSI